MLRLRTQKDFRYVRSLPFCYLCGSALTGDCNKDHSPPENIFLEGDRTPPLILPTHTNCNNRQSQDDERIGQLVRLLHREKANQSLHKWDAFVGQVHGAPTPTGLIQGSDLRLLIWRWVCAFHAALYREHLPLNSVRKQVHPPIPSGRMHGEKVVSDRLPDLYPIIVEEIKKNRIAKQLDSIVCYNGKCVYDCVWVRADRGEWLCMFALRLYNWETLGDPYMGGRRGCAGVYQTERGCPKDASVGTSLILDTKSKSPLDPFEEI